MKQAKRFIGSGRKFVVSDYAISRTLAGYHLQPLCQYLKTIANKASHNGKCCVDVHNKKLNLVCVDASMFGNFYGCVFRLLGEKRLYKIGQARGLLGIMHKGFNW